VLALSLIMRYQSRLPDGFGNKVIAALRNEFGGHPVKAEAPAGSPASH
jgi:6-phosphogluconate dehydrogenase